MIQVVHDHVHYGSSLRTLGRILVYGISSEVHAVVIVYTMTPSYFISMGGMKRYMYMCPYWFNSSTNSLARVECSC